MRKPDKDTLYSGLNDIYQEYQNSSNIENIDEFTLKKLRKFPAKHFPNKTASKIILLWEGTCLHYKIAGVEFPISKQITVMLEIVSGFIQYTPLCISI